MGHAFEHNPIRLVNAIFVVLLLVICKTTASSADSCGISSLEFPFCVDDETLSRISSGEFEASQSHKAACGLRYCDLDLLPAPPSQMSMKMMYSGWQRFGMDFQQLFAVKSTQDLDCSKISTLAKELDTFVTDQVSSNLNWRPDQSNLQDFLISARTYWFATIYLYYSSRLSNDSS